MALLSCFLGLFGLRTGAHLADGAKRGFEFWVQQSASRVDE